jgi:glutamine cyclotransferase
MNSSKRKYLILVLILAFIAPFILINCDGKPEKPIVKEKKGIEILAPKNDAKYVFGDQIKMDFKAHEEIVQIDISANQKVIASLSNQSGAFTIEVDSKLVGLGKQVISVQSQLKSGKTVNDSRRVLILSDITPKELSVVEVQSYTHLNTSYTQGLEFYNGQLYEGTGQFGESLIAKVDWKTGVMEKSVPLSDKHFGEGITIFNDKLYQITWKSRKCFIYNVNTLEREVEMEYFGEGWGLTHDSTHLIMSNGSNEITFRNPDNLAVERTINIVDDRNEIVNLNELEYFNGSIWANVYQTSYIVEIDPASGKVLTKINGANLVAQKPMGSDVFNGIAYNHESDKIYVTGKNWDKLYEVKFE